LTPLKSLKILSIFGQMTRSSSRPADRVGRPSARVKPATPGDEPDRFTKPAPDGDRPIEPSSFPKRTRFRSSLTFNMPNRSPRNRL